MQSIVRQVALVMLGIVIAVATMVVVLMVEMPGYSQSIDASDRAKLTKLIKRINR